MHTLFNVLHVMSAVFIVGPMAILPMTAMRAVRAGQGSQVALLAKSTAMFTWLSLLVAFFGFGVMGLSSAKDHFSMTTPWILSSVVLYLAAFALSLFLVVPAMRSAAARLQGSSAIGEPTEGDGPKPKEYSRIAMGSGLASLLLVIVVILMVWKP